MSLRDKVVKRLVNPDSREKIVEELQKYIYIDKSVKDYNLEKITLTFIKKNIDNNKRNDGDDDGQ